MPRKKKRDYSKLPDPIPDTPENIIRAVLETPPKKIGEWRYLKDGPKLLQHQTQEESEREV